MRTKLTELPSSSIMRPSSFLFAVIMMILLPVPAKAAEPSADFGSSILQLGLGSALVLGLLFATLWLLKKIGTPRGASANLIRVIGAAAVGPRERVVVVSVGGKHLVLGVAPGRVSLLGETVPPALDIQTESVLNSSSIGPEFAQWLKRTMARRNEK